MMFCKLEYKTSEQMEDIARQIAENIKRLEDELDTYFEQFKSNANDSTYAYRGKRFNLIGYSIRRTIDHLDPVFKNEAFHQENEWRITFFEGSPPVPTDGPLVLDYRFTDNDIVRHYVLNIKDSIKALTIGPLCRTDREAVKLFLAKEGLPTIYDICSSKATLQLR
jgi:hypothetical protein